MLLGPCMHLLVESRAIWKCLLRVKTHEIFLPIIPTLGIYFIETKADIKNISTKVLIAGLWVVPKELQSECSKIGE